MTKSTQQPVSQDTDQDLLVWIIRENETSPDTAVLKAFACTVVNNIRMHREMLLVFSEDRALHWMQKLVLDTADYHDDGYTRDLIAEPVKHTVENGLHWGYDAMEVAEPISQDALEKIVKFVEQIVWEAEDPMNAGDAVCGLVVNAAYAMFRDSNTRMRIAHAANGTYQYLNSYAHLNPSRFPLPQG